MERRSGSLTVCVIGQNQAAWLDELLAHASTFADEIVYVDGGSTDESASVVSRYPKTRFFHRPFDGNFARQRNYALDQIRTEWVLSLDTDEKAGPDLLAMLPMLMASGFRSVSFPCYWLAQENPPLYVVTRRHYPKRLMRLFRSDPGIRYDETRPVHEVIPRTWREPALRLNHGHILHYCFAWLSKEQRERKVARYEATRPDPMNRELYVYEDYPHGLEPCLEAWLPEGPRGNRVARVKSMMRFAAFALAKGALRPRSR